MEREYVISSMITSIGYDYDLAILEVEFKSNHQVWQYFDVPSYVFEHMKSSESFGKYFLQNIRGHFKESRIA